MDDLLEAFYQRYRAELKGGRDISDAAKRAQIRKDIEADPDLEVDRNAPKEFITDQEMDKRFPELAQLKDEIQAKRYARRNQSKIPPNYIEASWDISKTPSPTYILARGNYLAPGSEVKPGLPLVLDNAQHPLEFPDPAKHPEWNGTNPPADPGEVDGVERQSAGAPRIHESCMGLAFRRGHRSLDG